MSKKRKRDGESDATASVAAATKPTGAPKVGESETGEDDEFEGFSEDDGGLELDAEDDSSEEGEDEDGDEEGDGNTLLEGSDVSDAEEDGVDEEVLAISEALATAKKDGRKQ